MDRRGIDNDLLSIQILPMTCFFSIHLKFSVILYRNFIFSIAKGLVTTSVGTYPLHISNFSPYHVINMIGIHGFVELYLKRRGEAASREVEMGDPAT